MSNWLCDNDHASMYIRSHVTRTLHQIYSKLFDTRSIPTLHIVAQLNLITQLGKITKLKIVPIETV